MLDARKLLDQFLGTQETRHRPGYDQRSSDRGAPQGSGNPLVDGIGKALGGVLGSGSHGRGSAGSSALPGAIAGGLASLLLKNKRRKGFGGSMARTGGMALVAGLAYKAFQEYQARQGASSASPAAGPLPWSGGARGDAGPLPSAAGTSFQPAPGEEDARARLLLSAMIAAAKADGYIDREEQEAIFGRIDALDLDPEAKGFVMDEMRKPLPIDDIARQATSREVAVEVYLASVLAIDPDHPAEIAYLDRLAARLDLPADLVAEIRRTATEAE